MGLEPSHLDLLTRGHIRRLWDGANRSTIFVTGDVSYRDPGIHRRLSGGILTGHLECSARDNGCQHAGDGSEKCEAHIDWAERAVDWSNLDVNNIASEQHRRAASFHIVPHTLALNENVQVNSGPTSP